MHAMFSKRSPRILPPRFVHADRVVQTDTDPLSDESFLVARFAANREIPTESRFDDDRLIQIDLHIRAASRQFPLDRERLFQAGETSISFYFRPGCFAQCVIVRHYCVARTTHEPLVLLRRYITMSPLIWFNDIR